jgi:hypothetical protein
LQNYLVGTINSVRVDQDMASLGLRWDIDSHNALKLQWSRMRVHENGWVLWFPAAGVSDRAGKADVLSATWDFVF